VLVGSAVGYGLGVTVLPFYTLGAFVVPLEQAFGWSRAQVQGSLACLTLATLAVGWVYGALTDRHGAQPVAAASQVGLGLCLMLLALVPGNIWIWYGLWLLMSLAGLGTSPISWTRGISGWFDAGRGMALAVAMTGSGLCALVAPVGTAVLIQAAGWRTSYAVLGAIVLAIGLPVTLFLYPRESSRPGTTVGRLAAPLVGMTAAEALRGFRFWTILASAMLIGFAITGLIPNLVPLLVDRGMGVTAATSYMGVLGVTVIGGRIVAGLALDRLWAPLVGCIFLPLPAIACMILAFGPLDPLAIVLAVALLGFATGAEFDLVPYLCTRYFGLAHYGRIYSLQWIGFTTAAGVAPALFGLSHDLGGSYTRVLIVSSLIYLAAPLMLLPLGRYPRWKGADSEDGPHLLSSGLSSPPVSA
jgi:MFS family permease